LIRALRRAIETALVWGAFATFGWLSIDSASRLGGFIGRTLGPRLPVSRRARDNLHRAFPKLGGPEIERVVVGMWDNLGRVAAEYPHLGKIDCYAEGGRVEVIGVEILDRLSDEGASCIFFGGHIANWEIAPLGAAQRGMVLHYIYRRANNLSVERIVRAARAPGGGRLAPKGRRGTRLIAAALRDGDHLGMLVDQKFNEGIAVPFFGRDAMTSPALATLHRLHGCRVVPARVERLGGARFRLTVYPPLEIPAREADAYTIMCGVNTILEGWIRERPEQWLWLHRRWPN
jgi:KDO2-lipid IV(A) lauroyltransferase